MWALTTISSQAWCHYFFVHCLPHHSGFSIFRQLVSVYACGLFIWAPCIRPLTWLSWAFQCECRKYHATFTTSIRKTDCHYQIGVLTFPTDEKKSSRSLALTLCESCITNTVLESLVSGVGSGSSSFLQAQKQQILKFKWHFG